MQIDVLTLFPQMFAGPMDLSMMWKAQELGLLQLQLHDLRDWGEGRRRQVDDTPCGGGGGMILRADVLGACYRGHHDRGAATGHSAFAAGTRP